MKRHLKKKQNGPLHDTQGFNAAELQAVKDSVQEVNDCSAYAQIQSSQIRTSSFSSWMNPSEPGNISFLSFSCGRSNGVTEIMNIKAEKFDTFIFTSKQMGRKRKSSPPPPPPRNSSDISFLMVPNQFELSTSKRIFVPNFMLSSHLTQLHDLSRIPF